MRILSIARLALHADRYRLVLVDEPPARQIDHNIVAETKDQEDIVEEEIAHIIHTLFPRCIVIVVAHHASTIK